MNNWNDTHPELKQGEVFLRNDGNEGFQRVKATYPSARQGNDAFNIHGTRVTLADFKPIFCQKSDIEPPTDVETPATVNQHITEPAE